MKRLLILLCLLCLPATAFAGYPPAIPYGDLFVQTETLDAENVLPVYTGPGGEYLRGSNGKAAVSTADWVQAFCTENGYTLVQYEVDFLRYRFGWVKGEYTGVRADFHHAAARITRDAALTDDPLGQRGALCTLTAGTEIVWLASMGSAWIYVEAETDGAPVRGFVLRDHLDLLEPEEVYAGKLYPVLENGLWGYMDYQSNVVIAPRYASAGEFRGAGYACAIPAGGDWENGCGIIDLRGEWVVEPLYYMDAGYDGYLYGGEDTGVVWLWRRDDEGENSLDGFFDFASGYYSGLRFICNVPWVSETDNLIAVGSPYARGANDYGYVDRTTGELVLDYQYGCTMNPMVFTEGYAIAVTYIGDYEEERYYVIDKSGRELKLPRGTHPDVYGVNGFREGLMAVYDDGEDVCGFINTQGKLVIPMRYSDVYRGFSQGLCAVEYGGKWGYIDHDGEWVIRPAFDRADSFSHNAALVRQDERFLLIDRTGRTLYDFGTDWAYVNFTDYGVTIGKDGLILDTQGNVLLPVSAPYKRPEIQYDHAFDSDSFEEGLQAMADQNENGLMGYFDTQGNVAIPFIWDEAYRFRNGLAMVVRDGMIAYIDHGGNVVWQER